MHNILVEANAVANRDLILYRRQLRDNSNPFALPDIRFIELFRLTKDATRFLITSIEPYVHNAVLSTRIVIDIRVLVALRFYATGGYQRSIGEDFNFGISQTSANRCIHEVTGIICNHLSDLWIKFPQTLQERNVNRRNFMNRFQFPGVIGN